ncbi:MAG: NYN domain-containing protein [Calditrichaeota bacterium]|nr:NYN domain-containing protein [Calditrichota bacterium]
MTREIAGSVPPQAADLWAYAEQIGFKTTLLRRVENGSGRLREQLVDEILHLRIVNTILDRTESETIILLSGDGRLSPTGMSFPVQLRRALTRGWKVEIYSWEASLNTTQYNILLKDYPELVTINLLDQYYDALTFVKEINYYEITPAGNKTEVFIPGRVVQALSLS